MSKLYERENLDREAVKDLPETHEVLPELPTDVTIPDDVSGITHPMRAGGGRAASGIRWMRWMPAVLLLVAGAVALGLVLRGDNTDTVASEPWVTITEGPGSNSLAAAPFEGVVIDVVPGYTTVEPTEWATVRYGPASNSLAATPVATLIPWTTPTEGPGSNSLAPTSFEGVVIDVVPSYTTVEPTEWATVRYGPGSNSLAATPVATLIPWTTPTEGPGSNSLAP